MAHPSSLDWATKLVTTINAIGIPAGPLSLDITLYRPRDIQTPVIAVVVGCALKALERRGVDLKARLMELWPTVKRADEVSVELRLRRSKVCAP